MSQPQLYRLVDISTPAGPAVHTAFTASYYKPTAYNSYAIQLSFNGQLNFKKSNKIKFLDQILWVIYVPV